TIGTKLESQQYALAQPGVYLPVAGRPRTINVGGVAYDNAAGVLTAPNADVQSYTVTSDVGAPDRATLRDARVDPSPNLLAVPLKTDLLGVYRGEVLRWTQGAAGSGEMDALVARLHAVRVATASQEAGAPGSSEGRLRAFQIAGSGTSEQ